MTISVGAAAPDQPVEAYIPGHAEAECISVADFRGSWVVLVFYPRDFTFVCPTELAALAELQPAFDEAGAAVLAASTDSVWSHRAWFEQHPLLRGVAYPVLADTSHELSRAFGVLQPDGSALRGSFVIDPDGVVRHASATDQNVGRSVDETLRVVQALQTGELCPVGWRPGQPTLKAA